MAATFQTPYMLLTIPNVGIEVGPAWASEINTALSTIDSHTHISGQGRPIPTAGIQINADLSFNTLYNLTAVRSIRPVNQSAVLALASDLNCFYVVSGNAYFNDGSGNQIQLTAAGVVNTAGSGNITGMGGTTATVTYVGGGTKTFTFSSNTNTPAQVVVGNIVISQQVASGYAVTLSANIAQASNFTLTFPAALPGSTSFINSDSSGNLAFVATTGSGSVVLATAPTIAGIPVFSGGNIRLAPSSGGLGNAGSPYMTPSDSTNMGLYFNSTSVMGLSAGGLMCVEYKVISSSGSNIGCSVFGKSATPAGVIDIYASTNTPGANDILTGRQNNGTVHFYSGNTNGATSGESGTAAIFKFTKDSNTGRSINAAGTINASGADYAEYIEKENPNDFFDKGEVCGVNAEGKLSKSYSRSHSFVVKSTDPAYVGGDKWGPRGIPDKGETWTEFDLMIEEERKKWDRIAFCGQVPCLHHNKANPGQWVVAMRNEDDTIAAIPMDRSVVNFDVFLTNVVGKVWSVSGYKTIIAVGMK